MAKKTFRYSIHGVNINVASSSSEITDPVNRLLEPFREHSENGGSTLSINFEPVRSIDEIPIKISPSARRLYSRSGKAGGHVPWTKWPCTVYLDQEQLIAEFPTQGMVLIDGASWEARGYLIEPAAIHPDNRTHMVQFALRELLKRKQLFTVHSAALEKNGRGILIPGASGRGKTTTFLSLLRSGYRSLSDDHPFIQENGNGLELLAFPVMVDVTDKTIGFFPEIQESESLLHPGSWKRCFHVEDLYPGGTTVSCPAHVIVFPHVVDCSTSQLIPLPKSQALEELLPHGLLVYDREVAKREFQVISKLVQQANCYRLDFGRDVLDLPQLINPILETM